MSDVKDSLSGQAALLNQLLTEALGPELDKQGLTLSIFDLLSAVLAGGQGATQISVARRLGISAPSLTEAVQNAVTRGLLEQEPSASDRRSKTLSLTAKGKDALQSILQSVNSAESEMVVGIQPADLSRTVEVLRQANRNLAKRISRQ